MVNANPMLLADMKSSPQKKRFNMIKHFLPSVTRVSRGFAPLLGTHLEWRLQSWTRHHCGTKRCLLAGGTFFFGGETVLNLGPKWANNHDLAPFFFDPSGESCRQWVPLEMLNTRKWKTMRVPGPQSQSHKISERWTILLMEE